MSVTKDMLMDMFLAKDGEERDDLDDEKLNEFLQSLTPLCHRRRLQRSIQYARKEATIGDGGLGAILSLKRRCNYPYI